MDRLAEELLAVIQLGDNEESIKDSAKKLQDLTHKIDLNFDQISKATVFEFLANHYRLYYAISERVMVADSKGPGCSIVSWFHLLFKSEEICKTVFVLNFLPVILWSYLVRERISQKNNAIVALCTS